MSEKAKVYFGSVQHGKPARFASFTAKVDKIIEKMLEETEIEKKDKVAIKMHLGFRDGYQTIPVFFVKRIVEAIKKKGAFPFITDNPTSVYNAVNRGYTQETCGCPLIPVAGVKDGYVESVSIDFEGFENLDLGGVLKDADVLIDLSHAKGHGACGYGGAIKNLALGAYSGPTRWKKIHGVTHKHIWDKEKGSPEHAKKIIEACHYDALKYDKEKHELSRNYHNCHQCMACLEADREVGALELPREAYTDFQKMMAISTKKVLETFKPEKVYYITFLFDITMYCDCFGIGQPSIINDIGVVGSRDIIAIEMATLDLMKEEGLLEQNIPPYVKREHINLDPNKDVHPLTRIHGPYKDPYEVVKFLEKMDVGTSDYELIEFLSPEEVIDMKAPKQRFEDEPTFF